MAGLFVFEVMSTPERDLIVGGQAVIEGVMMRTPNAYAIAVRKADGTIVNTAARLPKWSDKYPLLKWPVLRGDGSEGRAFTSGDRGRRGLCGFDWRGARSVSRADEAAFAQ